jgi:hypothetical protein
MEVVATDVDVMRTMLARLRELAPTWGGDAVHVKERGPDGLRTWIRVPDLPKLLAAPELSTVGFFGAARAEIDQTPIHQLETQVVDTLERTPGVLCYFDLELEDGRYGNLILLTDDAAPAQLHGHGFHRRAVELTPLHYHWARLHYGRVASPLLGEADLVHVSTREFLFD